MTVLVNPGVGQVGHFLDQRQVIAPERRGLLPVIAILVDAGERHIVTDAPFGLVGPNTGLDPT